MITITELKRFYSEDLSWEQILDMASKLDAVAITVPGFNDRNDRDAGKDAYNFHCGYIRALKAYASGEKIWFVSLMAEPIQYLAAEIDILIHGCHTDFSPAEMYVKGGSVEVIQKLRSEFMRSCYA